MNVGLAMLGLISAPVNYGFTGQNTSNLFKFIFFLNGFKLLASCRSWRSSQWRYLLWKFRLLMSSRRYWVGLEIESIWQWTKLHSLVSYANKNPLIFYGEERAWRYVNNVLTNLNIIVLDSIFIWICFSLWPTSQNDIASSFAILVVFLKPN